MQQRAQAAVQERAQTGVQVPAGDIELNPSQPVIYTPPLLPTTIYSSPCYGWIRYVQSLVIGVIGRVGVGHHYHCRNVPRQQCQNVPRQQCENVSKQVGLDKYIDIISPTVGRTLINLKFK